MTAKFSIWLWATRVGLFLGFFQVNGSGGDVCGEPSSFSVDLLQTHLSLQEQDGDDVYSYVDDLVQQRVSAEQSQSPVQSFADLNSSVSFGNHTPEAAGRLGGHMTVLSMLQDAISQDATSQRAVKAKGLASSNSTAHQSPEADDVVGVSENASGDLVIFLTGIGVNGGMICSMILFFSLLRQCYPLTYSARAGVPGLDGNLPPQLPESWFGWMGTSLSLSTDDVTNFANLDHGMLIEFCNFAMRASVAVGLPCLLVLAPIHFLCGGGAAGDDNLSKLGFANVVPGSWTCWVQAVFVWYVVVVTQWLIFRQQRSYLPRRYQWLKEMPEPRATTVMVEEIPEHLQTAESLKEYLDEAVFCRQVVKTIYMVKDTSAISPLIAKRDNLALQLQAKRGGKTGRTGLGSGQLVAEIRDLDDEIKKQQSIAENDPQFNQPNAFVTFHTRRDALMALKLFSPDDNEEIIAEPPPDPSDVLWKDLMVDENAQWMRNWLGNALIAVLFFTFLPMVIAISAFTTLSNLESRYSFVADLTTNSPWVAILWDSLMGSFALSFMMGMLPTFLVLIFSFCFILKADAWLQFRIQQYYFYFLVMFVLLVTAVGSSLMDTFQTLVENPLEIFHLLAATLPAATHFYLNYFPVQWTTHAMNLTRYMSLAKYALFARFYEEKAAAEMAEPEDQDYYGMGSRSARFTLLWVCALTFCTLSPLISILAFINFALCRLIYSYLFVYAETRKPDLGGVFWCCQLKHAQQGTFLFIVLMTGVLLDRAATLGPGLIAGASSLYMMMSYNNFLNKFRWELLEFNEVPDVDGAFFRQPTREHYKQPELPAPNVDNLESAKSAMHSRLGFASKLVC